MKARSNQKMKLFAALVVSQQDSNL